MAILAKAFRGTVTMMNFLCNGYKNWTWLISVITFAMLTPSVCGAIPLATVGLSGGIEAFRLKEFDSTGARLLSETGNRYITTAFLDNGDKYEPKTHLLYHLEASAYWGQVDYDGKSQSVDPAQSSLPLMSQTEYRGGRAEALLGYRFKSSTILRTMELMGGVGGDSWDRRIHSATTSNGTLVSGIEES